MENEFNKELKEISQKLSVLISLGMKDFTEEKETPKRRQGVGQAVNYLSKFGLEAKEISDILGSPLQSVRTLLTPKRKKK